MLLSSKTHIPIRQTAKPNTSRKGRNPDPISITTGPDDHAALVAETDLVLTKAIGLISPVSTTHYYSFGNYNLVRLIMHLIKQTGPVNLFMTSYSFSTKSIEQLQNKIEKNQLLSFRLLIDNRVKSISPKPFQMIATSFDYRCTSVHAKIALLWNDDWKITIVTSQNATDNPKMERGTIYTDETVFNFDHKTLTDAFNRGNP